MLLAACCMQNGYKVAASRTGNGSQSMLLELELAGGDREGLVRAVSYVS
jgi:hypothetical protein